MLALSLRKKAERNPIKYAFINKNRETFNINLMCKALKVNRASYYHWISSGSVIKKVDEKLNSLVESIFIEGKSNYGTRRVKDRLLLYFGLFVSRKRISNIMKELKLKVKIKRRYKNTTDSKHNLPIASNILNRDFYASNPNEKYVGDITYISTGEGWLYLATVIDLYSRKVVGWSMDDTMKVSLVNNTLNMALRHRIPKEGLVWHTDRGSQYASYEHRDLLKRYGITQSMSRKGNCWDNSVAESFFKSLKNELVYQTYFYTKKQAKLEIFKYIELFYNRVRSHSYLNGLSPVEFEEKIEMLHSVTAA